MVLQLHIRRDKFIFHNFPLTTTPELSLLAGVQVVLIDSIQTLKIYCKLHWKSVKTSFSVLISNLIIPVSDELGSRIKFSHNWEQTQIIFRDFHCLLG